MFPFLTRVGPLEYRLVRLLKGRNLQLDSSILAGSQAELAPKEAKTCRRGTQHERTTHELDWESSGACDFMCSVCVWGERCDDFRNRERPHGSGVQGRICASPKHDYQDLRECVVRQAGTLSDSGFAAWRV